VKKLLIVILSAVLALFLLSTWGRGGFVGRPTVPLADKDGVKRLFPASEADATRAITNAFGLFRYRRMLLDEATGSDFLAKNWHPTNGFLLDPSTRLPKSQ